MEEKSREQELSVREISLIRELTKRTGVRKI